MEPARTDRTGRLVVCLLADDQVIDHLGTALRYLQIGLIDEPIDTILILPEGGRAGLFTGGPGEVITYPSPRWPLTRRAYQRLTATVQRTIGASHPDASVIVHCLTESAAQLAADLAAATQADLLINISSAADLDSPGLSACIDRAAALVVSSDRLRDAVTASFSARKPIEVIPIGATADNAPAAFSTPQLAPTLVCAGALSFDSGIGVMVRAAQRVLQTHPNLLTFIIGKGPAEVRLRNLVDSLDLRQAVTFTGRLEHWRHAIEAADIFCLPSSRTAVREEPVHALAAGLAVVAAEESLYDGLIDQQTALLFPDDDDARLAEQICTFLDNPEFARTLAATAQAHAHAHNSVARMVANHVRIYRQLESRGSTFSISPAR
jgi:glycosyltransferase involved in cell wall biosynthesis